MNKASLVPGDLTKVGVRRESRVYESSLQLLVFWPRGAWAHAEIID